MSNPMPSGTGEALLRALLQRIDPIDRWMRRQREGSTARAAHPHLHLQQHLQQQPQPHGVRHAQAEASSANTSGGATTPVEEDGPGGGGGGGGMEAGGGGGGQEAGGGGGGGNGGLAIVDGEEGENRGGEASALREGSWCADWYDRGERAALGEMEEAVLAEMAAIDAAIGQSEVVKRRRMTMTRRRWRR